MLVHLQKIRNDSNVRGTKEVLDVANRCVFGEERREKRGDDRSSFVGAERHLAVIRDTAPNL